VDRRSFIAVVVAAPLAVLGRRKNRISNVVVAVPCGGADWVVDKDGVENWFVPYRPEGCTGRVFADCMVAVDAAWENPRPVRINLVFPPEAYKHLVRL